MGNMEGKVVLITGANGGLGKFVSRKFLDEGAIVVGTSRAIQASDVPHPKFVAISVDLSDDAAARKLGEEIVTSYKKIDALIHVAGGFAGGRSVAETDDATWNNMRDMNLTAAFYVMRAVLPYMRKAKSGRIVAVGSLAAAEPHAGIGAYVVFKSALEMLMRTVALENADAGITANIVLPGTMDTPANRAAMPNADFSSWVQPSSVADAIAWLAADEAAHITGTVVPISGR